MGVELARTAIDLGIVIRDSERSLAFYRDLLGFVHEGDMAMPGGGGTMHRLRCGESLFKLVKFNDVPRASSPQGGIGAATGFRYVTLHVTNLDPLVEACRAADVAVAIPVTEIRAGVRITIVTDPDGNLVEFLQAD
jgi:catechol 2,3-dioxygenase-like lactoylglutathione lyase family enzyme